MPRAGCVNVRKSVSYLEIKRKESRNDAFLWTEESVRLRLCKAGVAAGTESAIGRYAPARGEKG
jgi:hypothetical protein